jgi:SPP1 gp7 family putative phage head morphogenesis protein
MATEKLIEQTTRHSIYTQRFAGRLANLFDPYIDRLIRELKLIMIEAPETTQSIRRINQIVSQWRSASLAIYGDYNDDVLFEELRPFATNESEWELDNLKSVVKSPSVTLAAPSPVQVWAAVNSTPLIFPDSNGVKLLDPFIKGWEKAQIDAVSNIIRTGFITGRTSHQITQDITGKNGYLDNQNRKSIKTMVRTATNQISNMARNETFAENDDIVIGYQIIATLDGRTSSICRHHDNGKVYNKGLIIWADGSREKTKARPMPAFHPNCRSTTVAILDERYGIDDVTSTRASAGVSGGKQVSATEGYYSWLKKQGEQGPKGLKFVQDVLGRERGDLLINGGLSSKQFQKLTIDELFRPIPLDELRKKQSLQFAFDKID